LIKCYDDEPAESVSHHSVDVPVKPPVHVVRYHSVDVPVASHHSEDEKSHYKPPIHVASYPSDDDKSDIKLHYERYGTDYPTYMPSTSWKGVNGGSVGGSNYWWGGGSSSSGGNSWSG